MPTKSPQKPEVGVGGVILSPDGRVLLARRKKEPGRGLWAFPGGRLEWGESLFAAACREVEEETGLRTRALDVLYVGEIRTESFHYVLIDILLIEPKGDMAPSSDVDQLRWVGLTEWEQYSLADGMAPCLGDAAVQRRLGWGRG